MCYMCVSLPVCDFLRVFVCVVCVYVWAHLHTHLFACACVFACVYVFVCLCLCVRVCVLACVCCVCVGLYLCVFLCFIVCVRKCLRVWCVRIHSVYVCTYVYIPCQREKSMQKDPHIQLATNQQAYNSERCEVEDDQKHQMHHLFCSFRLHVPSNLAVKMKVEKQREKRNKQ